MVDTSLHIPPVEGLFDGPVLDTHCDSSMQHQYKCHLWVTIDDIADSGFYILVIVLCFG